MSDKKICPFCGGVMTPIYNGDMTKHVVYEWECSRSSCQFSGGYFGADGLAHRNMKKIIKWKEEINALRTRIAELEAENERLTKAVEKAVQKLMNACPTDAYPCPIQLERESLYKRCDRCWRQYLMGDE